MTTPLPAPVLLVGVGNDLRGDDSAGLIVARTVDGWNRPAVRVLERRQLTPELAADVAAAASLVLVDAAVGGSPATTCEPVRLKDCQPHSPLTHDLGISDLLALAAGLYGRSPPAWIVSIPARDFGIGDELSEPCREGIASAIRLLALLLPER